MSSVNNNSVDTVNAAATAIVSAESRLQPTAVQIKGYSFSYFFFKALSWWKVKADCIDPTSEAAYINTIMPSADQKSKSAWIFYWPDWYRIGR
ncbi:hypothetical protein Patl1_24053 [Pistacia atlantica]|uniref:Uncharacterized protein n=1 Tax=Pistacia atlantica TaxID=434234 RepID=A0ACC0ZXV0_9ROSI|nr:hypothetical protein Patl1_24053 [Pistacia atlantica]